MNSYQRLNEKLRKKDEYIDRLFNDVRFYFTESVKRNIDKDFKKALWVGDSKPTGEIEGLFKRLTK